MVRNGQSMGMIMKTLLSIAVMVTIQFSIAAPLKAQNTATGAKLGVTPDLNIRSQIHNPGLAREHSGWRAEGCLR